MTAAQAPAADMVLIPGGRFRMGSDDHYPEEAPARDVEVDGFWIDVTPVTNGQFAAFVAATGHRTLAEIAPDPADYPGMPADMAQAGSLVFDKPEGPVGTADPYGWWRFAFGADWRHPLGPGSSIEGLDNHPVVHIGHADAQLYAQWAGKRLPTEAEWERAARGGLDGTAYAWGDTFEPGGAPQANYWQGSFPWLNLLTDGYERTSPVGTFAPNRFGLHDMIGNVWEWTADWYGERQRAARKAKACCVPRNPRGGTKADSLDPLAPGETMGRRVLKGGSYLCAANYCQRYRPAARYPQSVDTTTCHVGFRCARDA